MFQSLQTSTLECGIYVPLGVKLEMSPLIRLLHFKGIFTRLQRMLGMRWKVRLVAL